MTDVTNEYKEMVEAFSCDMQVAKRNNRTLDRMKELIYEKDERLMNDIDLLEKMEIMLRHGLLKIMEVDYGKAN